MAITRYQASIACDNANIADFRIWAGDQTGIAFVLASLGFTKQADVYTAQWANAAAVGAAALPTAGGNLIGATFSATTNASRTALVSTHFNLGTAGASAWVSGHSYIVGDVVIDTTTTPSTPVVYICTTNTSSATAPQALAANWSAYFMEIWGSTNTYAISSVANAVGANTTYTGTFNIGSFPVGSTATISGFTDGTTANNGTYTIVSCTATTLVLANSGGVLQNPTVVSGSPATFPVATSPLTPVYIKMEYGSTTSTTIPMVMMQFGTTWTGSTSSGFLSGNVSLTEQLFLGTAGTQAATECDFCGDGNTFFVAHMFRAGAAPGPAIFGWERSISGLTASAPVYASTYLTYIRGYNAATTWWQQSLFLSGTPVTAIRVNYGNTLTLANTAQTLIVNATTPALPVFPLLGYCGNPMTILIAQNTTDSVEGGTITCTVYGRTNTYLLSKTTFCLAFGGSGQTVPYAVGIRFDTA